MKTEDIDNNFWWAECLNEVIAVNKEGQPIGNFLKRWSRWAVSPLRATLGKRSKQ